MNKYVQASIIVLCLSLSTLAIVATYRITILSRKITDLIVTLDTTGKELQGASKDLGEYVKFQTEDLKSDRTQKSIDRYFRLGETGMLTLQKIDRTTVPRLNSTLEEAALTIASIRKPVATLDTLIGNVDVAINKELIPKVAKVVEGLGATTTEVTEAIKTANLTLVDLDNIVKNKDIPEIIEKLNKTTTHIESIGSSFDEGLKKFPSLMENFEKYSKASTTWQRRLYLAMIIRQLAAIPLRLP